MFRTVPLPIIRSFSLYTQQWYSSYRFCWQLASSEPVWHIPSLCVQWKTPDDGQRNCPKHVEFHSQNKFEKLVHLVGFIRRISNLIYLLQTLHYSYSACVYNQYIRQIHFVIRYTWQTETVICFDTELPTSGSYYNKDIQAIMPIYSSTHWQVGLYTFVVIIPWRRNPVAETCRSSNMSRVLQHAVHLLDNTPILLYLMILYQLNDTRLHIC